MTTLHLPPHFLPIMYSGFFSAVSFCYQLPGPGVPVGCPTAGDPVRSAANLAILPTKRVSV